MADADAETRRRAPAGRAGRALRRALRARRLAAVALAACAWLAASAANPEPAHAVDLFPFDDALKGLAGGAADIVEKGFEFIIGKLFGGISGAISKALITWLTAVPNFAARTRIDGLRQLTTALAFGLALSVITLAVIRYWLAGLSSSGSGGIEAVEGISRTVGALLLILLWPWLFRNGVALANTATAALLGDPEVTKSTSSALTKALAVGVGSNALPGVGWIISIIIALAGAGLTLTLVLIKVACNAALALLYVAMPIALILWPIDELSWLARFAARALTVVLLVPFLWALCFAVFGAVGAEAFGFGDGTQKGLLQDSIVTPVTAIGLLYLCMAIPRQLLRAAAAGPGGAGGATAGVAKGVALGVATRGVANAALGGGGAPALAGAAAGAGAIEGRPDWSITLRRGAQATVRGPGGHGPPTVALGAPGAEGDGAPGSRAELTGPLRLDKLGGAVVVTPLPQQDGSGARVAGWARPQGVRLADPERDRAAIERARERAAGLRDAQRELSAEQRQRAAVQAARRLPERLVEAVGQIQTAHEGDRSSQERFLPYVAAPLERQQPDHYDAMTALMSFSPEQRSEAVRQVLSGPWEGASGRLKGPGRAPNGPLPAPGRGDPGGPPGKAEGPPPRRLGA